MHTFMIRSCQGSDVRVVKATPDIDRRTLDRTEPKLPSFVTSLVAS
jgi:hypothetical protein